MLAKVYYKTTKTSASLRAFYPERSYYGCLTITTAAMVIKDFIAFDVERRHLLITGRVLRESQLDEIIRYICVSYFYIVRLMKKRPFLRDICLNKYHLMQRLFTCIISAAFVYSSFGQDIIPRLNDAVKKLEEDAMMKHGMMSLHVADSKTGNTVFSKNAQVGLAPASCQKVITSVAAFEILGGNYRYKTQLSYDGRIEGTVLKGSLYITGSGDPTLGSPRFIATTETVILQQWIATIRKLGISGIEGWIFCKNGKWSSATIPDGWIWQDIGNYYGAGAQLLNWRENQYDLTLKSGNVFGDTCEIVSATPELYRVDLTCEVTAGEKGSGDNAYIYLAPYTNTGFVRGTIPPGKAAFSISGSFPNSAVQLQFLFTKALGKGGIRIPAPVSPYLNPSTGKETIISTVLSPPLDSINYWFMRRSINLYGEALLKTIAFQQEGIGSTSGGVEKIRSFWSERGIERSALNIFDGSGLSPQNRVTADALVKVMLYARGKTWFKSFYNALPLINGIRMKSGSIGGARSFAGYITGRNGNEYTFAILVNNYDGSATEMVSKMYRLLDILK